MSNFENIGNIEDLGGIQLLINVEQGELKLKDWAKKHAPSINEWLSSQGALLIRGLNIMASRQFGDFLTNVFGSELLSYSHRSTPRTELRGNVYTATEYHSDQLIQQHNEQAYTNLWPMRIGFFCMLSSDQGGETPIADSREIYKTIPEHIRNAFADKCVMYVRNFSELDLPWTEVFCTEERSEVEAYCKENDIQFEWLADGGLRTKQILPAVVKHPDTQEWIWFNQAHLFHVSALEEDIRRELIHSRGKENLPRNTYFGDGSDIPDEYLQEIRDIYQAKKIKFEWQKGDVMLLDNMLFSHGREPFSGERKVLVGMSVPCSSSSLTQS
ncbi:TauD/TfdA family dioxygenase [Pleionea sp. CnH1-48]|uniref:TauD/TfdA family dioxygenase n=1 Tax=Pleionea sp. CnH1-48 TaxID=2954494 RepID=UPI0020972CDD|nr:TauD/TfdA family dioxygenase [Pleionea sp. CnH1-48]MCO7226518.1 TauD/TfdA family dioxygenase [Pleionea sp. CnH1-48]